MAAPYIQQIAVAVQTGTSVTSYVITTTAAPSIGNTVIGIIKTSGGKVVTSVTDSVGNTWVVDVVSAGTATMVSIVRAKITVALPIGSTITLNFAANTGQGVQFLEYTGSWTLDKTLTGFNATSATTGSIGPTATITSQPQMVISGLTVSGNQGSGAYTAPSGYDYRPHGNTTFNVVGTADKYVTSVATQSASWSWTTSANWTIAIATYIPNATPTVVLNTADLTTTSSTTPTLEFTGTDAESNDIRYNIQIDTVNTFNSQTASSGTVNAVVGASADDARNLTPNSTFTATSATQHLGNFSGSIYYNGWRFTNVTVPQGATITAAPLTMYVSNVNGGTTANVSFWGEATDNAATFSSTATPQNRVHTTAQVNQTFTTANWVTVGYQSVGSEIPDLTAIIQEVVNRPGWTSGNSISIVATDNGSSNPGYVGFATFDNASTKASKLDISYTVTAPLRNKVSNVDAGFLNTVVGGDTDPFNSGQKISHTVQTALSLGTYYWRVRGIDPLGSNAYSSFTAARSFTISSSTTTVAITKALKYTIKKNQTTTKGLKYTVKTTPAAKAKALQYATVKTGTAITKTSKYSVRKQLSITKGIIYDIKRTPAVIAKSARYAVKTAISLTKSTTYRIRLAGTSITKSNRYAIRSTTAFAYNLKYTVRTPHAAIAKAIRYAVKPATAVSKLLKYTVKSSPASLSKSLTYRVRRTLSLTKVVTYGVRSGHAVTKALKYDIKLPAVTLTKTTRYVIFRVTSINKNLKYTVKLTAGALTKTAQYTVRNAMSGLKDDFNDNSIDSTKWNALKFGAGSLPAETGGRIVLSYPNPTVAVDDSYLESVNSYDFTNSAASFQVLNYPVNGDISSWLSLQVNSNNRLQIENYNGVLYFTKKVAGTQTNISSVTYDPSLHSWQKISESSGTVTFWTSPDGKSWTSQATTATPFNVTVMRVYLECITWSGGISNPGTFEFDNFNLTATAAVITKAVRYAVKGTPLSLTKPLKYTIRTQKAAITKSSRYAIKNATAFAYTLQYEVKRALSLTKAITYKTRRNTTIGKQIRYAIKTPVTLSKQIAYILTGGTIIVKTLKYEVKAPKSLTKTMTYSTKLSRAVTKTMSYDVKRLVLLTKNIGYTVKKAATISKSIKYATKQPVSLAKATAYRIKRPGTQTKPLAYKLSTKHPITKAITYVLVIPHTYGQKLHLGQQPEALHLHADSYSLSLVQQDNRLHLNTHNTEVLELGQKSNSIMLQ